MGWQCILLLPALGRLRKVDLCEFKASLVHRVRYSTARATQHSETLLNTPPQKSKSVVPIYTDTFEAKVWGCWRSGDSLASIGSLMPTFFWHSKILSQRKNDVLIQTHISKDFIHNGVGSICVSRPGLSHSQLLFPSWSIYLEFYDFSFLYRSTICIIFSISVYLLIDV